MAKKTWEFQLEDGSKHTVRLEYGYWGKRKIHLDDQLVVEDVRTFDTVSSYSFPIGKDKCAVHILGSGYAVKLNCTINDRSVETGKEVLPPLSMPGWAWLFIIACGIIPLITLGGMLPAVMGGMGALACATTARDSSKEEGTRIAICTGVTVACWAGFLFLRFLLSS